MKRILKPLVYLRRHILALYILALILVLAVPLPADLLEGSLFWLTLHFLFFFGLHVVVEFAHLFKGERPLIHYTIIMAVVLEAFQIFFPHRYFDPLDMAINISGVIVAHFIISYYRAHPFFKLVQSHAKN